MTTILGRLAMLAALACAMPAHAQLVSGLNPAASPADIAAAIDAATPPPCPAPMPDALVASAGSASNCMPRSDARRATQVQTANVTTNADGTFTGTWPVPWTAGSPSFATADIRTVANPYICQVGTITATGFTGTCFELFATTLGATLTAIAGTVVSPVRNAAAGLGVDVIGRQ